MVNINSFDLASKIYDDGNYDEAFKMFLSLANTGDIDSMLRVALMYSIGEGCEYDIEKSKYWDMKAASQGSVSALFNLGITFRNNGDVREAKKWFQKALNGGEGEAALQLAKMYLISDLEIERVKSYLLQALQVGNLCESSEEEVQLLLKELGENQL